VKLQWTTGAVLRLYPPGRSSQCSIFRSNLVQSAKRSRWSRPNFWQGRSYRCAGGFL